MEYIVKDVGESEVRMSKDEVVDKYGTDISQVLISRKFVESVVILDDEGKVKSTITKETN